MNQTDRLNEFARHKERLITRIEQQRGTLSGEWHTWEKPAALVDRGIAVVRFFKSHPLLITAGLALVVALRLHKFKGWLGRGLMLWRFWRSASTWLGRRFD
jgi:hypothetical protein